MGRFRSIRPRLPVRYPLCRIAHAAPRSCLALGPSRLRLLARPCDSDQPVSSPGSVTADSVFLSFHALSMDHSAHHRDTRRRTRRRLSAVSPAGAADASLAVLSTLWIAADSLWFLVAITARRLAGLPNLYNQWQSFLINARALTTFALLTVLMTLLFREQRRNTVERAAFAAELEAARVVQQVLILEEIPNVPGFRIESIYKPAGQAKAGDFFQILPTTKGGVLIVIGDVSGKGMPAAMTVSLLVGTIRTLAHYTQSPAEILAAMNQRMLGRSRGGFTTCLALHVTGDGELFAANAGHLAPYRNGEELPIESGLPLGLSAGSAYAVAKFRLDPGSRFTLLTDGVVEARETLRRTLRLRAHRSHRLRTRRKDCPGGAGLWGRRMTSRSLPSRLQARGWRMRRATNVILYLLLFLVAVSGVVRYRIRRPWER